LEAKLLEDESRGFSEAAVTYASDRCVELRLLDDASFALQLASHKWRTAAWSAGRIRLELRRRLVPTAEAEGALGQLFGADGEAAAEPQGDEEHGRGADALLAVARRQWRLSRGASDEARLRRLAGWLARRGHGWATVREVSARLAAEEREEAVEEDES